MSLLGKAREARHLRLRSPGECRIILNDNNELVVLQADRDVWLTDDFLYDVAGPNKSNPWVDVTYQTNDLCSPDRCCQRYRGGHCFGGAVITIRASNATVIYRVGAYNWHQRVWECHRLSDVT